MRSIKNDLVLTSQPTNCYSKLPFIQTSCFRYHLIFSSVSI